MTGDVAMKAAAGFEVLELADFASLQGLSIHSF